MLFTFAFFSYTIAKVIRSGCAVMKLTYEVNLKEEDYRRRTLDKK